MLIVSRQSAARQRRNVSRAHGEVHSRVERKAASALTRFFRDLTADVVARIGRLSTLPESAVEVYRPSQWHARFNATMAPHWGLAVWSGVEFEHQWVASSNPSAVQSARVAWTQDAADPPPSIRVDPSEALLRKVRAALRARQEGVWGTVGKTTHTKLGRTIAAGLKAGDDLDGMAARVRRELTGYTEWQARRVARTETTVVMNHGGQLEREELGIGHKEWISVLDARNRGANPKSIFDHLMPDGQTVANAEAFTVSGQRLMFPGDGSLGAGAGNVINCRCASVAAFVDEPVRKPKRRPKPKPKAAAKPVPAKPPEPPKRTLPDAPRNGMTFTGEPTDFGRSVWDEIGGGLTSEEHARRVGEIVRREVWDDPAMAEPRRAYDEFVEESRAEIDKARAEIEKMRKKLARTKNPTARVLLEEDIRTAESSLKWAEHYAEADRQKAFRELGAEANAVARRKLREIRDFGSQGKRVTRRMHRNPAGLEYRKPDFVPMTDAETLREFDEALEGMPTDFVNDLAEISRGKPFETAQNSRGFQKDNHGDRIELITSGRTAEDRRATLVHEFTHTLEGNTVSAGSDRRLAELEKEFFDRRTKGRVKEDLGGSMAGEMSYKGVFHDDYMGKEYAGRYYEVATVGNQEVLGDDVGVKTIWGDEDTTDFVLGLLAGY